MSGAQSTTSEPGKACRRILVIKLRHIGDVLVTTPVYRALAEHYPGAEITACVNAGTEAMLKNNPWVADVLIVPKPAPRAGMFERAAQEARFVKELRSAKFDHVIDLTGNDRSAILTRISGAKERWGFHRLKGFVGRNRLYTKTVNRARTGHTVEQQIAFLQEFGISTPHQELFFHVSEGARERVARLIGTQEFVHVHPVSRVMEKCWPAPFLAQLIDVVAEQTGWTPVITASASPVEKDWVRELVSLLKSPALDLSGKLELEELGAISQRARVFIGVDSAPMHIAAAVGTPVIGIFGPSSETLWGPWCRRKLVLSRELDCRLPCKNKHACSHIECLRAMTPQMVLPQVTEFLRSLEGSRA